MRELAIIIPALNEEAVLRSTLEELITLLQNAAIDYEIILVNDGSIDETHSIVEEFAKQSNVTAIHKSTPENIGNAYRDALKLVNSEYVTWIPADGEIPSSVILKLFNNRDSDKVVIAYPENGLDVRPLSRVIISKVYQFVIRVLFLCNVRYFNCPTLLPISEANKLNLISTGFTINMETVVRAILINRLKYTEIGFKLAPRKGGEAKAISIRNIINVVLFVIRLRASIPCI